MLRAQIAPKRLRAPLYRIDLALVVTERVADYEPAKRPW
jgi:hypothetical protein